MKLYSNSLPQYNKAVICIFVYGGSHMSRNNGQMSEAFFTAVFLSASGGLQDAYTYIQRGSVFANAQTGNIVLLSQTIFSGNWSRIFHYAIPLLAFALGVAAGRTNSLPLSNLPCNSLETACFIGRNRIVIQCWLSSLHAESACQCSSIFFMRHASTSVPESQRLFLCQYHVHRKLT